MNPNVTGYLATFLLAGLAAMVIAIRMLFSYSRSKNPSVLYFALGFLFVAGDFFCLSVPGLFFHEAMFAVAAFHVASIAFMFLCLIVTSRVESYTIMAGKMKPLVPYITWALVIAGVVSVADAAIEFTYPVFTATEVHWNTPLLAAWVAGVSVCVYGLSWGILFINQARKLPGVGVRIRMIMFAMNGSILGIGGFLSYAIPSPLTLNITSVMISVALVGTVLVYLFTRPPGRAPVSTPRSAGESSAPQDASAPPPPQL